MHACPGGVLLGAATSGHPTPVVYWQQVPNSSTACCRGDVDGIVPVLGTRRWIKELDLPIVRKWRPWVSSTGVYSGTAFAKLPVEASGMQTQWYKAALASAVECCLPFSRLPVTYAEHIVVLYVEVCICLFVQGKWAGTSLFTRA